MEDDRDNYGLTQTAEKPELGKLSDSQQSAHFAN